MILNQTVMFLEINNAYKLKVLLSMVSNFKSGQVYIESTSAGL